MIKTERDLLAARIAVIDMCDGTGVKPEECWKYRGMKQLCYRADFQDYPELFERAIAIVENRPVFVGDTLLSDGVNQFVAESADVIMIQGKPVDVISSGPSQYAISFLSWNPPKPPTLMVELTREDAEIVSTMAYGSALASVKRVQESIRKALEGEKS